MTDLTALSLCDARDGLAAGDFTSSELTEAYITAIEAARGLNAFILETPDAAREMAAASDRRRAEGKAGALDGVPFGVKDLFCTKGIASTAASKILGNFVPPYESTVTDNLWKAGAVLLGKLNLDEFAMGSSTENSAFGNVINPWRATGDDTPRTPGGSSGGSAAAVAAHLCAAALGTDTGGPPRSRPPSGSSPPTAAVRATASSPMPRPWTRPAPSPARCGMPPPSSA